MEVVGIGVGDIVQLLRLILVEIDGILVENVLDCVCPQLVVSIERMKMFDGLGVPSQVIVDFEMTSGFRRLLKFS